MEIDDWSISDRHTVAALCLCLLAVDAAIDLVLPSCLFSFLSSDRELLYYYVPLLVCLSVNHKGRVYCSFVFLAYLAILAFLAFLYFCI